MLYVRVHVVATNEQRSALQHSHRDPQLLSSVSQHLFYCSTHALLLVDAGESSVVVEDST
jgi:hypothetical protein